MRTWEQDMQSPGGLRELFRVLGYRKGVIALGFLCVFVTVVAGTMLAAPTYRAAAVVMYKPVREDAVYSGQPNLMLLGTKEIIKAQEELIKRRPLIEEVVREIGLERISRPAGNTSLDRTVEWLIDDAVTVEAIGYTGLIKIQAENGDPEMATEIANKIARGYIDYTVRTAMEDMQHSYEIITAQVEAVKKKLRESDESLREFREEHQLVETESGGSTNPMAAEIKKRLLDLRTELRELSAMYTEKNPQLRELRQEIERYSAELEKLPEEELELNNLIREVKSTEKIYLMLLEKFAEARISEATDREKATGVVKLVEPAVVPTKPVRPRKGMNLVFGFFGGLMFGFGLGLVLEYSDHSLKTVSEVNKYLDLQVLSCIPRMEKHRGEASGEGKIS